jgi:reductive dehalogenase
MKARRPSHLGPYPMEKLKRVATPTTLLHEDEIPQASSRALFYARGAYGDLGPKIAGEMHRWVRKHPMANAIRPVIDVQVPHQDGPVAASVAPGNGDAAGNARAIKALCHHMGAEIVGIGPAPRYTWYSHDKTGNPIERHHKHAIVLLIDQGQDTIEGSTGDDWISGSQSGRAYMRGAEIAGMAARHIRSLGFAARAHSNVDSQVLQVPLLLLAGVGELSRIGEVVLNPFLGPRFKSAVITTDLPLEHDRPVDFNLQDMCAGCRKCARECPSNAISFGPKVMFNGYEIWKPDVERCIRYRVTNSKGSSCGRCTKVCPYSHQGLLAHRVVLNATIRWRWARRLVPRLDDWMGYGEANPVKRWWSDLEILGGKGVPFRTVPAKATNERRLERDEAKVDRLAAGQKISVVPASKMPPPNLADTFPLNRAGGIADHALLETPEEAVERRRRGLPPPASYTPPEPLPDDPARTPMVDLQRAAGAR